jgi:methylated-DNA-protein-cysteine methyltransferase-like protein
LRSVKTHAPTWSESVYAVARMIPRGKVATYGQIAALLGRPRGGREVGWALSGCDDPRVPCHRVVDRNGRLAPHFCAQRARLTREHVRVGRGGVDIAAYGWRPTRAAMIRSGRVADGRFLDKPELGR